MCGLFAFGSLEIQHFSRAKTLNRPRIVAPPLHPMVIVASANNHLEVDLALLHGEKLFVFVSQR